MICLSDRTTIIPAATDEAFENVVCNENYAPVEMQTRADYDGSWSKSHGGDCAE